MSMCWQQTWAGAYANRFQGTLLALTSQSARSNTPMTRRAQEEACLHRGGQLIDDRQLSTLWAMLDTCSDRVAVMAYSKEPLAQLRQCQYNVTPFARWPMSAHGWWPITHQAIINRGASTCGDGVIRHGDTGFTTLNQSCIRCSRDRSGVGSNQQNAGRLTLAR